MNGILNLNKPVGHTSFNIVTSVKRICRERHVGHAGTLDPMATGVLPVFMGKYTRIIEYLMDASKTYLAWIKLGVITDTCDVDGKVILVSDASQVSLTQVESILLQFNGNIEQIPPAYSALKYNGKPLYAYAREGLPVVVKRRNVTIHEIKLLDFRPPIINLRVVCSKGTYIRSLARDIGEKLGCGAHLQNLIRESYGPFNIKDAVSIDQLEDTSQRGNISSLFYSVDVVLAHMPMVILTTDEAQIVINGGSINLLDNDSFSLGSGQYCRAYTSEGSLLAVLKLNSESHNWHPEKVFP